MATAITTACLVASAAPAKAESAESIGKIAQAITVRVEGVGSPGSGVLVKRDGKRYTVITAWHVVSGQRPGEELAIITPDGQTHPLEAGSIKRLGQVDMAVLIFSSPKTYELARIGDVKSVSSGEQMYVAGFPAANNRTLKFESGRLEANATVGIDQGYQLLYTNYTVSGMSGGAVLSRNGTLIGIHGRGELDPRKSEDSPQDIKTGLNYGLPIDYYRLFETGLPVVASNSQATTADDYLAQARSILVNKGAEDKVIKLINQSLSIKASVSAYFYRAFAKHGLGDNQGAIADYTEGLAINPKYTIAYINRGMTKSDTGDKQGAIADYNQALAINPQDAKAYLNRGIAKYDLGDKRGAIADFSQALAINSQDPIFYNNRGIAKYDLGDNQGAITDYTEALAINPKYTIAYNNRGSAKSGLGNKQGAIADYTEALAINPKYTIAYINRGMAKSDTGDKQGAIADYNQVLAINPQDAKAYFNRGIVKHDLGDKRGAIADYNQALAIDPKEADYYYNRGNAKSNLGDKRGAIADYSQAIAINPKEAAFYNNRGEAKSDSGDKRGAIADYNQAIANNPKEAVFYSNRAIALEMNGDLRSACGDLRSAASLGSADAAEWARKQCQ